LISSSSKEIAQIAESAGKQL